MNIVIGADPWGAELKEKIKAHIEQGGHSVVDVGTTGSDEVAYYNVAAAAARMVQAGQADRGILLCGTGMGVALVANKFKGVIASVVESVYAARMCRAVNNANVLTMGAMMIAPHQAILAVDAFLTTDHTDGLDEELSCFLKDALEKIAAIEDDNLK